MELKDIVLSSYELLVKLPKPEENKNKKFEIKSRNKLKNLPEALRELDTNEDNITHFVKTASYSLPRAESGKGVDRGMMPFLDLLLEKVIEIKKSEENPQERVKQIKYLIGYTNWNADAVCTIFTADSEDAKIEKRLTTMLEAELSIINSKENISKIIQDIMEWKNSNHNSNSKYRGRY